MVYPTYPTVLPRHELTGPECTNEPEWFKRRDVRAPKPFLQRLIDAQLEPLKDELHFTRQLLFENEGLGHFLERLQTAEQKELSAREKVWEAVERAVAAQEGAASAETKLVRLRVKGTCFLLSSRYLSSHFAAAAWKGELDQVRVEKERLEGKNAQLQGRLATGKYSLFLPFDLTADITGHSKSSFPHAARGGKEGGPKADGQAGREGFAEAFIRPERGGEKAQQSCQEESA